MQELALSPATIVLLVIILACAVLALRRMLRRGMCDCSDHCDGCDSCHGSATPAGINPKGPSPSCCAAAEDMLARAEQESKR